MAERNLNDGLAQIRRWWTRKYNRPSTDPLFTGQTAEELHLEMFDDLLVQREEIMERLGKSMDIRDRENLREKLHEINDVFGYKVDMGEDALIDEWERDLEAGKVPDLSKRKETE